MLLTADNDLTRYYASGWALALTITPADDSAHLAWSPSGYSEDGTFEIRLGRDPLSEEVVQELTSAFEEHPGLDIIRAASWEYAHDQGCWRWAAGPWWEAVADLEAKLWHVIDRQR